MIKGIPKFTVNTPSPSGISSLSLFSSNGSAFFLGEFLFFFNI
jgi:hypothetical protein